MNVKYTTLPNDKGISSSTIEEFKSLDIFEIKGVNEENQVTKEYQVRCNSRTVAVSKDASIIGFLQKRLYSALATSSVLFDLDYTFAEFIELMNKQSKEEDGTEVPESKKVN